MEAIVERVFSAVDDAGIERDRVRFIYLFGSVTDDPERARDIDICLSLDGEEVIRQSYKIRGRLPEEYDLSVFEDLPLQVKAEVFKGELLYARDDSVYDAAFEVFRDFEYFEPLYKTAIGS